MSNYKENLKILKNNKEKLTSNWYKVLKKDIKISNIKKSELEDIIRYASISSSIYRDEQRIFNKESKIKNIGLIIGTLGYGVLSYAICNKTIYDNYLTSLALASGISILPKYYDIMKKAFRKDYIEKED